MPYKDPEKRRKYRWKNREKARVYYANWRKENERHLKDSRLQYSYGISIEQYEKQLTAQGGVCAICGQPQQNSRRKALCVDHNAITGALRELLCDNCNKAIGCFKEDTERMQKAIVYLEKHKKTPTICGTLGPRRAARNLPWN